MGARRRIGSSRRSSLQKLWITRQTHPPRGPVRHADRSARRTLIVKNRHESKSPLPPADAGGAKVPVQMRLKPDAGTDAAQPCAAPSEGDGFEAFFRAYPKKKAEMRARRQWQSLAPNPALQLRIIAAVEAQAKSEDWKRNDGQYVPMASSWLHGERWRDVVGVELRASGTWWESTDGVKAKGFELSIPFSLAALGNSYTDDERNAHWRAYRLAVFAAAGDGPWSERRAA